MIRLALILCILATTAGAQMPTQNCGARGRITIGLEMQFGEQRIGIGLASGGVMELWASPRSETWTLLRTMPNGRSCIVVSGKSWQDWPILRGRVVGERG